MKKTERDILLDIKTGEEKKTPQKNPLVSPVNSVCPMRSFPFVLVSPLPPLNELCSQNTERERITHLQLLRRKGEERRCFTHAVHTFFSKSLRLIHPVLGYTTHLASSFEWRATTQKRSRVVAITCKPTVLNCQSPDSKKSKQKCWWQLMYFSF